MQPLTCFLHLFHSSQLASQDLEAEVSAFHKHSMLERPQLVLGYQSTKPRQTAWTKASSPDIIVSKDL